MLIYWIALALAIGTILGVYYVLRSRRGLALAAIRDSELAAESVGVDSYRTKLWVYAVTAAMTGMIGALIYLQKARISPDAAFSVLTGRHGFRRRSGHLDQARIGIVSSGVAALSRLQVLVPEPYRCARHRHHAVLPRGVQLVADR
jgi:hypothetical protein